MELQPISFSLQSLLQNKCDQNQNQKQSKYLQILINLKPEQGMVYMIELILSDQYLYENSKLRMKVMMNSKGYVQIDDILNQAIIVKLIKQTNQLIPSHQQIQLWIKSLSVKLMCNHHKIRRRQAFIDQVAVSKPVYIEQFPENDCNEELETLLSNTTQVYKINYNHKQNWAIVYAQNTNNILRLNGHLWSNRTHLHVLNYEKARQSFRNMFTFDGEEINQIYKNNKFTQTIQQDQVHHPNRKRRKIDILENQSEQQQMDGNFNIYKNAESSHKSKQIREKQFMFPNFEFNKKLLLNTPIQQINIETDKPKFIQLSKQSQQLTSSIIDSAVFQYNLNLMQLQ